MEQPLQLNRVVTLDVLLFVCSLFIAVVFPRASHHQCYRCTKDDGSAAPGLRALSMMMVIIRAGPTKGGVVVKWLSLNLWLSIGCH